MEKIKEELNNLINLYNERKEIEKLTKNIEEKKKELEKLDNKVKLQMDVQLKNIAQKEFEVAQKEFEKMQKDKKTQQEELSKKFEKYKKSLESVVDEELKKYKSKSELDNLKSSKNAYEKIANNAEKTVKRLITDFNEGKNIDQSMLNSARKEIEVNREKAAQIQKEIEKWIKKWRVIETNEQYSDLTYLKLRLQNLSLEQLNENTEKDFYEKYFKDEEIIEPTYPENDEPTKPSEDNSVYEYLAEMDILIDYYVKLIDAFKKIIELEKNDNDKEIDKKLEQANEYIKKIRECKNEIEQMSKNIKLIEKENIYEFNLKQNEAKRYIKETNELCKEIKSIKSLDIETIRKDGRKIVEEYFKLVEKKAEMFKKLVKNEERVLLYKEENNTEMIKFYSEKEDEYKKSIKELKKQLFEMNEKIEPYLEQEDKDKITDYENKEKEEYEKYIKFKESEKALESSNSKNPEPKDPEPTKPNNNEKQKDINNLHFYDNLKDLKETKPAITYTWGGEEKVNGVHYQASAKWTMIRKALKDVYTKIDFESEEGQQELKKYEDADPNLVTVLSNNKNRLEEYIALLNREKKLDVNDKNALKITYDIRKLSKSELSKEEKEAIEDYAFKHRNIAEVKKTPLQAIKFKFREMKEKRENKKGIKALNSGKIVTAPIKDGISSEAKDTFTKAKENKNKQQEDAKKALENKHKQQEDAKKAQERSEEYNKNILLYQEKIENKNTLKDMIAKAQTDEERKVYEEKIEKIEEEIKALTIGSHSKSTEEQTEPENTETDNKQEDVSKKTLNKFEENAKKQDDEFLKNTSNWKDTLKVAQTPKPAKTTTQEQEEPIEATIDNNKNEKQKNNSNKNVVDNNVTAEKVEQELDKLPEGDPRRRKYIMMLTTVANKLPKEDTRNIFNKLSDIEKSLEKKIAELPENSNRRKLYEQELKCVNKNVTEVGNFILAKKLEIDEITSSEKGDR